MTRKEISTWWQRGLAKERARLTQAPKPHKGDRFSVPTDFDHVLPSIPRSRTRSR